MIDQQKQNLELSETVEQLTSELNKLRSAANDLYAELSQKSTLPDVTNVLPETGRLLREIIRENAENLSRVAIKEAEMKDLVKLNEQFEFEAKEHAAKLVQKGDEMCLERRSHEQAMASLQSKIQETEQLLSSKVAELVDLNAVNDKRGAELDEIKRLLETSNGERVSLQLKLTQSESELKATTEMLETKVAEVVAVHEAKESLQLQLNEVNANILRTECTLKTTSDRVEILLKEKSDLADRLKEVEQLIVDLNGEIIEAQRDATQHKQANDQKQSIIDQSEKTIAQLTDEKIQLEKDNLILANARAIAEQNINQLSDEIAMQCNENEQQQTEMVRRLEMCGQERDDLKSKLSSTENELVVAAETVKLQNEEISKLKQDISFMAEKHSNEIQDLESKRDAALAEIETLRKKIDEMQAELNASRNDLAASCARMDTLLTEKSVLEEKAKEAEATINTLNDELAATNRTVESEQAKFNQCEAENKRLESTIAQLTTEKNAAEEEIRLLVQFKSETEEKIAGLDGKLAELIAERDHLNKTIEMNANEHSTLNAKVQELTQASFEAQQRFVNELKLAEDRIKESNEVSISIIFLTHSFTFINFLIENRSVVHFQTIEKCKIEQEQLKSDLTVASDRIATDATIIAELSSEQSKLMESEQTLRSENAELSAAKTAVQNEAQELCEKLNAVNKCVADYETKIEQLTMQKAELETQAIELNERLSAIAETLSKSQEECLKIRSEMEEMHSTNEKTIEEQQTRYAEEKSRFEGEINELIQKRDSIEADLQLEREKLATEKATFEQKLQGLTEEKVQKESEATKLSEKIEIVEAELAQTKLEQNEALAKERLEAAEREAALEGDKEQLEAERSKLKIEIEQITSAYEQLKNAQSESIRQHEIETAARIASILSEKQQLEEELASMKLEMELVNAAMEQTKVENATFTKEKNALVTKVIELNRTIDEQKQELAESKLNAERVHSDLEKLFNELKCEKQSLQERFEQMNAGHHERLEDLQKQLTESVAKVEQHEHDNAKLKSELSNLQGENKLLVSATTNKDQLNALKSQIALMQKKQHDSVDKWNKEREAMLQDVKIFKAKLVKERELAEKKSQEHEQHVTEVRHEFEEKLEKMKDKMVSSNFLILLIFFCVCLPVRTLHVFQLCLSQSEKYPH